MRFAPLTPSAMRGSGDNPVPLKALELGQLASFNRLHKHVPLGRGQLHEVAFLTDADLVLIELDHRAGITVWAERHTLHHDHTPPRAFKASKIGHALVGPCPLQEATNGCRPSLMRARAWILASTAAILRAARVLISSQVVSGSTRKASSADATQLIDRLVEACTQASTLFTHRLGGDPDQGGRGEADPGTSDQV
jgi:hypothetical protein